MGKKFKVFVILFLILVVNTLVFAYIYLKNNVSVSLVLLGNQFTSNEEIFSKFEKRTDVFYWYINKLKIESQIKKLPYVKDVSIFPVSLKEFYKLNISIKEETPFYLVKLQDNQVQVISEDGRMLSYLVNNHAVLNNKEFFYSLPIVQGLDTNLDSSQTFNSRLVYIAGFIKRIKQEIPYAITSILFLSSGEAQIKFIDIVPFVILDLSKSDDWVETQLRRFNALKENLGTKINKLAKIDLAYSKVGVLKLKN